MRKKAAEVSTTVLLVVSCVLLPKVPALAQQDSGKPEVIFGVTHDVSPPLRDIAREAARPEIPNRVIPLRRRAPQPGEATPQGQDIALQQTSGPLVGTTAPSSFDGISADGVAPPDTNLSVGATQVVQIVNVEYAVYDKASHATLLGPAAIHTIWNGFGPKGDLCATVDGGDPIVLYDKAAGRWLISQLAYNSNFTANSQCIAVSTTSDATGSYNRYEFSFGSNLPDYPKFGVWPDAYYYSANMFASGSSFSGAKACAFDRSAMLAGGPASAVCFQRSTSDFSLLPSDLDGAVVPPGGSPNFFVELATTSSLNLYKFHVDFTIPNNSAFTGPKTISVPTFTEACSNGGTCIPQPVALTKLDSLGDRLMYRLAYRNFSTYESLVVNHSVNVTVNGSKTVGIRWYEIRSPNGTPILYQSGTFAPDKTYRWMGSIGMDKAGDLAVGYSVSSRSVNPGIRYTGRTLSDPLNTLESEATIFSGNGSQIFLSRWGDYSSISIDPSDDCTFWYTTEYIPSNGNFNWHTRIANFKFSTCQ